MTGQHALVSPAQIAEALGQFPPTEEQAAVISAPLEPVLVVAGAGAGKTETMAARVVWLVANGMVTPEQVLGLTFTRKAAQQLTTRIRQRLARLAGSGLLRRIDPAGEIQDRLRAAEPEVGTYHSYAGRLLGEYGLLLPMEPSVRMLGETQLWQLAHRVVSSWDGELETEANPTTITEQVLRLAGELGEHLVATSQLEDAHVELEHLLFTLPAGPRQGAAPNKMLTGLIDTQERRIALLPLVRRLAEELRSEGALDPNSQMSLAAQLAQAHPEVGEAERRRFRAVMLDEYQDTGHAQRVLLSSIFGGPTSSVALTAVGDPMQSIYGWRGASAANLPYFATDFPADAAPARTLELLTSWRNPAEALQLANAVAEPLRHRGVTVSELRPRPGVEPGNVRAALCADIAAEREWLADHVAAQFARAREADEPPPTAAVLVRRNADSAPLAEALRARGLPVEVVGLGGLLDEPEVRDVVSMLRLVADPLAGGAAMRVLTGARWRLGAADLVALARRARELDSRGRAEAGTAISDADDLHDALHSALPGDASDPAGLGDAIADPGPAERYSEVGRQRVGELAKLLASLRERLGQPLTELVFEVERAAGAGLESLARQRDDAAPGGGVGREHLDAFADIVADYASDPRATLTGFLSYLAAAESVEKGLAPGEVSVDPDRVQILTVHSAKGLEWEVVAVPHLVTGVFPSGVGSSSWLGDVTELPPQLRGDRVTEPGGEGIPLLELEDVNNRKDLENAIDKHKKALAQRRLDEDRRLFYVAVTRTEQTLLLSGHRWPATGKAIEPSPFLLEAREVLEAGAGVVEHWAEAPESDENPLAAQVRAEQWPADPLGARRPAVEDGARLVLDALAARAADTSGVEPGPEEDPDGWAADVEMLLTERESSRRRRHDVALPDSMSVSQVVSLKADPDALAERLRRPVPYKPNPLARRGTAFHAWIERRFGATRLLDLDELPGAADTGAAPDADLAALQASFLASEWAHRTPVEVETGFETIIGGVVLRGRMDAVFRDPDGGWTVIDWKTGAPPTAAEAAAVAMQLAVYRIAWAELSGSSLAKVRAAFHYVRGGRTVAPSRLPERFELAALLASAGGGDAAAGISDLEGGEN